MRYGSKRNGYHGGVSLQEAVVPVGVYVGPGEVLDGWAPVPASYPPWWSAESPKPAPFHLPVTEPKSAEPEAPPAPQPDLFMEAARKGAAAASRWDPLFESEVYVAQRQLAGSRVTEKTKPSVPRSMRCSKIKVVYRLPYLHSASTHM